MGIAQRRKGANGERELARILSDTFGWTVTRQLGQARDGGHDLVTGQFRWEVKRRKRLALYDFVEQAEHTCSAGQVPIVALRADGKNWLVVLRLEDALPMIQGELPPR